FHCYGVWTLTVEYLIRPQHYDQFIFTDIGNVVRPAWYRLDDLRLATSYDQLLGFARNNLTKTEMSRAFDDEEFLSFAMVVMFAARYAGDRSKVRELTAIRRFQHLYKNTARVSVTGHFVSKRLRRDVAQVSRIKCTHQS